MIAPPLPPTETARLGALRSLYILDTPPEERFDRITRLATRACSACRFPSISLVDEDRVWYKSKQGLEIDELPRHITFCSHAILDPDKPLVVNDATRDERFHDNPLVTDDPGLRFYASQPLLSPDGHPLGTFCIADTECHAFSDQQKTALRDMAKMAEAELTTAELNKALGRLRRAEENYRGIFENVAEGIFQVNPAGHYLNANPAVARLYGYDSTRDFMEDIRDFGRAQQVNPARRADMLYQLQQYGRVTDFESEIYPPRRHDRVDLREHPRHARRGRAKFPTTRARSTTSPRRNTPPPRRPRRATRRSSPRR